MLVDKFKTFLSSSLPHDDFDTFEKQVKGLGLSDDDLFRTSMDLAFRQHLTEKVVTKESLRDPDLDQCRRIVSYAIKAARAGMCLPQLPILLLSDVFELLTLSRCQELFQCVEENVAVWKEEVFFTPVRNHLLRICNDLLRRLSRSQNTVFCGRILVFLAKFFPLSERSGLNIISEFNLDNTTVFSQQPFPDEESSAKHEGKEEEGKDGMEVDQDAEKDVVIIEEDEKNLNIDYALYKKFWQLQDFFRQPTQCYERLQWKTFTTYAKDVLNTFESFKLDSVAARRKSEEDMDAEVAEGGQYFAKYLTNQHLLQLQLSDSNFRRYILVQFLILFQYLQSMVKFKSESEILNEEQKRWVKAATERVYKLLGETPPNGPEFAAAVKGILRREQQWNAWKNEGCPKFTKAQDAKGKVASAAAATSEEEKKKKKDEEKKFAIPLGVRKRKRKVGDQIREATAAKKFLMGNAPLTKLWNLCPDNLQASSAPERDFLPSVEEYFEEAIEQLNPDAQVEKEYKKVNDGAWGWRALRLMAKKSPHFFTYGNHPIARLPDYLEQMLKKMSKDSSFGNLNTTGGSSQGTAGGGNGSAASGTQRCSPEALSKLSERLGARWKQLIPKLGLPEEVEKEVEKEKQDEKDRALLVLTKWRDAEGEAATAEELQFVLDRLKMGDLVADGILSGGGGGDGGGGGGDGGGGGGGGDSGGDADPKESKTGEEVAA